MRYNIRDIFKTRYNVGGIYKTFYIIEGKIRQNS